MLYNIYSRKFCLIHPVVMGEIFYFMFCVNDYTELGYGDLYHMGKNIQGYNI